MTIVEETRDVVEGSFIGPSCDKSLNLNSDDRRFCVARGACPVCSPFGPQEPDLGEARRMKRAAGQRLTSLPCVELEA